MSLQFNWVLFRIIRFDLMQHIFINEFVINQYAVLYYPYQSTDAKGF